jgi:hypothetical protein
VYQIQEKSSALEELEMASQSLSQGLERRHCVLQDWGKGFIANNRCVEGMVASGTDSCCFNVGHRE